MKYSNLLRFLLIYGSDDVINGEAYKIAINPEASEKYRKALKLAREEYLEYKKEEDNG